MIRLEPREHVPLTLRLGAPIAAAALALVISAIPLAFARADVLAAYGLIFSGAFGSLFAFTEMLTRATPLILTGLAAVVLMPLVLLAGAAAGALMMLVPTWLKTRAGVDEVVTTLLLNFVVLLFVQMMLEGPMQDPMSLGWPQSLPVVPEAELPALLPRMRLHAGFVVALVAALLLWLMMGRSVWGFETRAVGANPAAARFAGMSVNGVMLRVGLISGALAGLAGVGEVAGLKGYLTQDLSPGFGYSGIVVAMLAQLNPLGVIASAIFVAGVFVGADSMSRAIGVSSYIADLVVATALLTMLLATLSMRYRIRWISGNAESARHG